VSTRRLILAALLCGMAILIAGGVFLFNVAANRDDLTLDPALALGESTTVAGRLVGVESTEVEGDTLVVSVAFGPGAPRGGTADAGWALNAGGEVSAPVDAGPTACSGQVLDAAALRCTLAYPLPDGSALLEYASEGQSARWQVGG
jgi:hypothetical protein